ncbi:MULTISPECIES: APC family permease [Paenarthrobacter]|uniref:APC family permease n=1 Tax=Paenarthrobacter ureafaciens TaxID=37931 RepID=A0AAX3EMV1_PAEUR|nr:MULTISPECIES: APC family permease [Paenarthrobacter]NKR13950.1 amino acid permease [Arthrobacter sp. M5]NKR17748.1 amino acid permease [Arthrobacter sp. M6]OEH56732.1 amino acid permease [Arthrobacter sp. D2]OEH57956.1 amino acid permease [Arthrobacter sp. D4]MDO5864518.1 APC family permease [Paenarthrobacter sp. SD-2]
MSSTTKGKQTPTRTQEDKLSGNMGVGELVMNVLAFSSPLTTVAGTLPVMLLFSGHTAPGIYLLVTLMLLIFSVGFVRMSRSVDAPGGFYSFVTAGLGKPAGLGGALLALVGYIFIGFFAPSLFALTLQGFVVNTLGGPEIPWYWYGLGIITVTTLLAYNRIDLSAKVLTVVMLLESAVVVIFDVAAFASGDVSQGVEFSMPWITDAGLGLALLFAVGNFFGFEATVIYRDEVKNPDRTIPRATYLAVVGIGLFYAVAAWAYTAFLGADNVQDEAKANTVNLFNDGATALVGKIFADIGVVLLITSILASMLSIQNIAARYSFSLAADGALPRILGSVHPRHKSPYVSAVGVGIVWVVATVVFTLVGVAPEALYPIASGSGTFSVLLLMFITSFAVLVYFVRRRSFAPESVWKTIVSPIVSVLFLGLITYLAIANYPELIGGSAVMTAIFMTFTFALFIGGIVYAYFLRSKRPEVYARLGRQKIDQ